MFIRKTNKYVSQTNYYQKNPINKNTSTERIWTQNMFSMHDRRVLLMWKHFQAGGLGPPWGPQSVQGLTVVGDQGAKRPEANGFYTFTEQFSTINMTRCSFFVYDCFSMILHANNNKKTNPNTITFQYYSNRNGTSWLSIQKWSTGGVEFMQIQLQITRCSMFFLCFILNDWCNTIAFHYYSNRNDTSWFHTHKCGVFICLIYLCYAVYLIHMGQNHCWRQIPYRYFSAVV